MTNKYEQRYLIDLALPDSPWLSSPQCYGPGTFELGRGSGSGVRLGSRN